MIKHDTKPIGKHKRKNSTGEAIGESEKKKHKDKDKQEKLAVRLSESELKNRIIHWLALRDMDKNELKRKCEVDRIPQGLTKDVAQWDQYAQLYRLLPKAVKVQPLPPSPVWRQTRRDVLSRIGLERGRGAAELNARPIDEQSLR